MIMKLSPINCKILMFYYSCPFHGTIDYLIYNKVNKYPIIPVVKSAPNRSFTAICKERDMSIAHTVAVGLWSLTN